MHTSPGKPGLFFVPTSRCFARVFALWFNKGKPLFIRYLHQKISEF